jgi:hypothetical protein
MQRTARRLLLAMGLRGAGARRCCSFSDHDHGLYILRFDEDDDD